MAAKVVSTSHVESEMQRAGWSVFRHTSTAIVFRNDRDHLLPIPLHPTRPDLIYLSDLTAGMPVLRQEFIHAASVEVPAADAAFDVLIMPGRANEADIQALRDALDRLNQAVGGSGLEFHDVAAVSV